MVAKQISNVTEMHIDLTNTYKLLYPLDKNIAQIILANTRARIRMSTSMIAGIKSIVVGTGNKVEDFGVGFFTKWRWWRRYKQLQTYEITGI